MISLSTENHVSAVFYQLPPGDRETPSLISMTTGFTTEEEGQPAPTMSTSLAHLNSIATGPTSTPQFSHTSSASTDAQRAAATGDETLGGMSEATAPLMRFLLNGRNASFFGTWYASEAVCLGMFR